MGFCFFQPLGKSVNGTGTYFVDILSCDPEVPGGLIQAASSAVAAGDLVHEVLRPALDLSALGLPGLFFDEPDDALELQAVVARHTHGLVLHFEGFLRSFENDLHAFFWDVFYGGIQAESKTVPNDLDLIEDP